MPTRSQYRANVLEFHDSVTHERVLPLAPIVFYDDFLGLDGFLIDESGSSGVWNTVTVSQNLAIGIRADTANGVVQITLDSDAVAQDGVIDWGDQRQLNVKAGLVFECRLNVAVAPGTGVRAVWGMCGDHNLAKDSATESAWFSLDAGLDLKAESDDTTNNEDDVTVSTIVAGDYHIYRIDFTDISDVRFYLDGVHVATTTTFDMSNLTDVEGLMQPYFSLDKASGGALGTLDIDYVRIWSERTELAINN